ncbi:hypothetical protein N9U42_03605 [Luminiphilus sp.]|nr:hypothetical protein [Luminiphilus sp.]MDA9711435.1 hypothetical protein [Luminiphilus sp.]
MSDDLQNVVDMAGTRVDDDHLLSMYIDNELDAERTIALVTRLQRDASLRARLTSMEANDAALRRLVKGKASVPEHLAPLVKADNVTIMPSARNWIHPAGVALAAGFAVVVALVSSLNRADVFNPMTMDPQLASALEHSPSQATGWERLENGRDFRSVLTFPAADGRWCREFLLAQDESHWRGVACRDNGKWESQVVGSEVFLEQETQYRPAGAGDSEQVARFIDETAADVALGPQQEAALISSGW